MIQPAATSLEPPRISANQLGEYIFASDAKRLSILRDQKFGNLSAAPYYSPAVAGSRRSFEEGMFSKSKLLEQATLIENHETETKRQATKWLNNSQMLRSLSEIAEQCNPPPGKHRLLRKNARFDIDGVTVSVYPEIVTENLSDGYLAFTKLRFSKSKIGADVSEIVLLILHHYGGLQGRVGLQFNFELSKIIDCYSKTVIYGHTIGRQRDQQLHAALASIRALWPNIEPE